jgi:sugar phosphate isomerase/epimerase
LNPVSRRAFLTGTAVAAAATILPTRLLHAAVRPVGLQLFSVRKALAQDYPGTLHQVAAIGYREVEAAGFYNHSAADAKQMMADAGLHCVSAHYSLADLLKATDATIDYAKTLGLEYVVCSAPTVADPSRYAKYPGGAWQFVQHGMTADDWKWNAGQFNQVAGKMKAGGIRFGYHNHTPEFRDLGNGTNGYQVLLKETDPALVTFELDCGWAIASGQDAAKLLREHGKRISMLHLKDLNPAPAGTEPDKRESTEIGLGVVDFKPIFAAARTANIKHAFVEQEDFDKPVFDALRIDFKNTSTLESGGTVSKAAS